MEKRVEVRKMTEQECMDISTRLREGLVELARVLPFLDMDDVARIQSCRLMEEIAAIIATYVGGTQTPLKLEILADRIREPVSMLCSLLEPLPICKANRYAYETVMAINSIIEKDIMNIDNEITLNDKLFDAPY